MWDTILRITTDRNVIAFGYILPLIIAVIAHSVDYVIMYRNERKEYNEAVAKKTNFYPSLTVGTIVGGYFLSLIPIVNFLYCTFGVLPDLMGGTLKRIGQTLNIHLVPKYTAPREDKQRTE